MGGFRSMSGSRLRFSSSTQRRVKLAPPTARLATSFALVFIALLLSVALVSCGGGDSEPEHDLTGSSTPDNSSDSDRGGSSDKSTISLDTPTPSSTRTPTPDSPPGPESEAPRFSGYDLDFATDDFWRFKWEWVDTSCAQGSGCSTTVDEDVFQITLGEPKEWQGVTVYEILVVGKPGYVDNNTSRRFVPEWDYLGVDGHRIVATNATGSSPLITIFDGQIGKWAGSGFFTSRPSKTLIAASSRSLGSTHKLVTWGGVEPGPMHYVGAASSQSKCEIILGIKVCPNEEAFDYTESEYFRPGVGPLGYEFSYAMSFSGGNFASSFRTEERVALVASSFLGDEKGNFGEPTPIPPTSTPEPSPTPVVFADPIYGPANGSLALLSPDGQIPEFEANVNIDAGLIDVTFENPNVSGTWSHGIFFRNPTEETFHAVFINSDGGWGHFARGGSFRSQRTLGIGDFEFDKSPGGTNKLTVWFGVLGPITTGYFQINDQDVARLDLSYASALGPGNVSVVSGIFPSDDFSGGTTYFTDFTIYEKP